MQTSFNVICSKVEKSWAHHTIQVYYSSTMYRFSMVFGVQHAWLTLIPLLSFSQLIHISFFLAVSAMEASLAFHSPLHFSHSLCIRSSPLTKLQMMYLSPQQLPVTKYCFPLHCTPFPSSHSHVVSTKAPPLHNALQRLLLLKIHLYHLRL